ncbi:hypothetical protein ANCCAN_03379 [Ancylostoma caninum]|uniref:DUF7083 domain-containing protein n=1 Tax=Ancylostoma caninum TaxID=29170 RepID=A0A368H5H9_ANCCA|nr:hypothetical protein ANCCAN_03379 [Ancylostoma caninum]
MISEEQFQRLLAALTHSTPATDSTKKFETLAGRIVQFCYDPEADLTFEAWYRRHADIFRVDARSLDEATRTPQEVKFDDAISTLKDLFGPQQSLFSTRYTCLKLTKDPKDDFAIYAGRVNRECAKFKIPECSENQFKCLIFVCGLQSREDAFIRLKLLDKIESDPNCTIQILAEERKRLLNLRHDTKMIENGTPAVHSMKQFLPSRQGQQEVNFKTGTQATHLEIPPRLPPSACWFCGEMHFIKDCPYRHHKCSRCRTIAHKEGYCNLSKRRSKRQRPSRPNGRSTRETVDSASELTVINKETWQLMGEPALRPPSLIAHSASGGRIQLLGQRQCTYNFPRLMPQPKEISTWPTLRQTYLEQNGSQKWESMP